MRIDESYNPKPRSLQMEMRGLGAKGEQVATEAYQWIEEHPDAWRFMVNNAHRLAQKGTVSINYLVHMVRNEMFVSVANSYAPAFARIMELKYPQLKGVFKMHRSHTDGFLL